MADIQIEYHRLAIKEGKAAKDWYEERSPRSAEKLEKMIRQAIAEIQADPDLWPLNPDGTRFRRVKGYPHLIIYRRLTDERVRIIAIAHSRRRPGYWSRQK
jgi:plasmid stabilization system protein ParE